MARTEFPIEGTTRGERKETNNKLSVVCVLIPSCDFRRLTASLRLPSDFQEMDDSSAPACPRFRPQTPISRSAYHRPPFSRASHAPAASPRTEPPADRVSDDGPAPPPPPPDRCSDPPLACAPQCPRRRRLGPPARVAGGKDTRPSAHGAPQPPRAVPAVPAVSHQTARGPMRAPPCAPMRPVACPARK